MPDAGAAGVLGQRTEVGVVAERAPGRRRPMRPPGRCRRRRRRASPRLGANRTSPSLSRTTPGHADADADQAARSSARPRAIEPRSCRDQRVDRPARASVAGDVVVRVRSQHLAAEPDPGDVQRVDPEVDRDHERPRRRRGRTSSDGRPAPPRGCRPPRRGLRDRAERPRARATRSAMVLRFSPIRSVSSARETAARAVHVPQQGAEVVAAYRFLVGARCRAGVGRLTARLPVADRRRREIASTRRGEQQDATGDDVVDVGRLVEQAEAVVDRRDHQTTDDGVDGSGPCRRRGWCHR